MTDLTFGEKLLELRTSKGLTQAQLGEYLGVSHTAISSLENGINNPSFENLIKIAELFDVSYDYLLDGYADRFKKNPSPSLEKLFIAYDERIITYREIVEWLDSLSDDNKKALIHLKVLLKGKITIDVQTMLRLLIESLPPSKQL